MPLLRVLTDRGTESCGKVEQHDYQLYLGGQALRNQDTPGMGALPYAHTSAGAVVSDVHLDARAFRKLQTWPISRFFRGRRPKTKPAANRVRPERMKLNHADVPCSC